VETLNAAVRIVQGAALVVVAAFVILLFVNEPAQPPPVPAVGTENAGATIFATRCAGCHGDDGGGGFGPALRGGLVVQRYPDPADEVAVVQGGRGSMPSFTSSLTDEQIAAVVEYTRSRLG
jgi:mono/diheme cytochrome c family protein